MWTSWRAVVGVVLLVAGTGGAGPATQATRGTVRLIEVYPAVKGVEGLVLFLPGISAYREEVDTPVLAGLRVGGVGEAVWVYDWPAYDAGMGALLGYERNRAEAAKVAEVIRARAAKFPGAPIYVVSHSGGCGVAAWALEMLPEGVKVEQWVMLAPALSKGYDLSRALTRVRGRAFVVSSERDVVVGAGTRVLGTMDRVWGDSGGLGGFERPAGVEAAAYEKLVAMPWVEVWKQWDNFGDHIGCLEKRFGAGVVAGLLKPATRESGRENQGAKK